MRNPKRIRPMWKCFIKYLKQNKLPVETVLPLKEDWLKDYDLRLGQLIWNNDCTNGQNELSEFLQQKIDKMLFHIEDNDLLLALGIPAREFFLWGKRLDEHGNQLKKTKYILLKDLDSLHLDKIIKHLRETDKLTYIQLFKDELELYTPRILDIFAKLNTNYLK